MYVYIYIYVYVYIYVCVYINIYVNDIPQLSHLSWMLTDVEMLRFHWNFHTFSVKRRQVPRFRDGLPSPLNGSHYQCQMPKKKWGSHILGASKGQYLQGKNSLIIHHVSSLESVHVLKWGYPEIIHLNRIFHYKPTILGVHHLWKPPFWGPRIFGDPPEPWLVFWVHNALPEASVAFTALEELLLNMLHDEMPCQSFDVSYSHALYVCNVM